MGQNATILRPHARYNDGIDFVHYGRGGGFVVALFSFSRKETRRPSNRFAGCGGGRRSVLLWNAGADRVGGARIVDRMGVAPSQGASAADRMGVWSAAGGACCAGGHWRRGRDSHGAGSRRLGRTPRSATSTSLAI